MNRERQKMINLTRITLKNLKLLLLCCGIAVSFSASAQHTVDSLKSLFSKAKSDTEKITVLNNIASAFSVIDSVQDALNYSKQAIHLSESVNSQKKIAESMLNASVIYEKSEQYDSAIEYIKQPIDYFEKEGASKMLIKTYKTAGIIFKDGIKYEEANEYLMKALHIAQQLKDSLEIYYENILLGGVCEVNGEFDLALTYYKTATDIAMTSKQYRKAVGACNLVASIYQKEGQSAMAAKIFFNALEINSKYLKQDDITGVIDGNLGIVYNEKNDSANAMKYYREALDVFTRLHKRLQVAQILGNIGNVYLSAGDYKKAEIYELQSMEEIKAAGNNSNIGLSYTNVAEFYSKTKQYDKALKYYNMALSLQQQDEDKEGIIYVVSGLSQLYANMGDNAKALEYGIEAYTVAKEIHLMREVRDEAKSLSELCDKMHQPEKAFSYYKMYIDARDSLENKEEARKLIRAELNHEYVQKQQAEKLEDEKRQAIADEKQRHERALRNVFLAAFVVVLFLTGLLLRNLLRIRKSRQIITEQKIVVENQKIIVEQKNKDITDSINYARRIQHAMLPTTEQWCNLFRDSFIYYRPKDIVSGDFYWCMESGSEIIFAAADCTGHGVPGAFMSMLGISSLNKIVGEEGIHTPDEVLNELREEIIHSLNPEGKKEEVKDGMDMTLCRHDKEKGTLEFSAANNPLWIVCRMNGKYELKEFEADKIPVGKYSGEETKFTLHKTAIKNGDRIYIFTDGFADQFGGPKGKKFMYRHLKEVVMAMQDKSMKEQGDILEKTMNDWKGTLEQVDDILVIGIEI
ncbi:MAG: tetratricopeptide repeat protein [Bacteroidia bacterium]